MVMSVLQAECAGFDPLASYMTKLKKEGSQTLIGDGWNYIQLPPKVRCKHGTTDCERCGVYERTDEKHTTVGGKGLIARLRKKK